MNGLPADIAGRARHSAIRLSISNNPIWSGTATAMAPWLIQFYPPRTFWDKSSRRRPRPCGNHRGRKVALWGTSDRETVHRYNAASKFTRRHLNASS